MIREKKDTETDREFEKRRRHLLKVLERSARKWFETNPLVCKIVADWRNDVFGFEQNREEVLAGMIRRVNSVFKGFSGRLSGWLKSFISFHFISEKSVSNHVLSQRLL